MVDEKEKNNTQQEHIAKLSCRKKIIKKFRPSNQTIYYQADIESCTFICYKKESTAGYNSFTKSLDNNVTQEYINDIAQEYIKQQYRLQDRKKWNRNQVQDYEHAYCIQSFYHLHSPLGQQLQQATRMFDSNLVKWLLENYHPQDTQRQSISRSITTYFQPVQLRHHQHLPCCYKSIKHATNDTLAAPHSINKTKGIDHTSMQHTPTSQIIQKSTAKLHTNMTHQVNNQHLLLKKYSIQCNKHDKIEATSHQQPKHSQVINFQIYQHMDEKEHSMAKHRKRRKLKKQHKHRSKKTQQWKDKHKHECHKVKVRKPNQQKTQQYIMHQ